MIVARVGRGSPGRLRRLGWLLALLLGCTVEQDRPFCQRDADCEEESLCYYDARCAPRTAIERIGVRVGDQCYVQGGIELGCRPNNVCRMGLCEPREWLWPAQDAGPRDGGGDAGPRDGGGGDAGSRDGGGDARADVHGDAGHEGGP